MIRCLNRAISSWKFFLEGEVLIDWALKLLYYYLFLFFKFRSENNLNVEKSMTITEVKSNQRINSCISANVSGIVHESDRSHSSLLLEMVSEECILDISNGSLYLRGICLVNSEHGGISSETFVLGAISEYLKEEMVCSFTFSP